MLKPADKESFELHRSVSLNHHLLFAKSWLNDPDITEIAVNRPCEVWCERRGLWEVHRSEALTFEKLMALAIATAKYSSTTISETRPILSAILPEGARIQIVQPPACEHGTVSITIRKPSVSIKQLSDFKADGFFNYLESSSDRNRNINSNTKENEDADRELLALKNKGEHVTFLKRAVQLQKVIVVAGETGSGKTTFMKALMQEIPSTERIITIEDVPELFLPNHPNHVHLFYPSEAKEEENAFVTATSLLKSCLRMKPCRILVAELRGGETFDFINAAASGHGGSITSVHAGSPALAFERLALMMLQNRQGRALPYLVIKRLLYQVIDIVVQVHNDREGQRGRHIREIWYDPTQKHAQST